MISVDAALFIHSKIIKTYGGSDGVRDKGALISALRRPFQTFDEVELYKTPTEKATAILESVLNNHPFIDGNKRTAFI